MSGYVTLPAASELTCISLCTPKDSGEANQSDGQRDNTNYTSHENSTGAAGNTVAELAERGVPVFPVKLGQPDANGKRPKTPLTDRGHLDASADPDAVEAWWQRYPTAVPGVPTGPPSGLMVLDVDPDGATWYAENAPDLAAGRIHKTERGHHLVYMHREGIRNSAGKLAPGVDIRADGGWIVWWPAMGLKAVGEIEEATPVPDWVVERFAAKSADESQSEAVADEIPEGQRDDALTSFAGTLRRRGLKPHEIVGCLQALSSSRCNPPKDVAELQRIARSVARYEPGDPILCRAVHEGDTQDGSGEWQTPVPLSMPEPSRLPVDQWPEVLRRYAESASATSETPLELAAMMALGAVSAAVQTGTFVEIKPGYRDPVCLYSAVVMPPGTRKSEERARAIKPLVKWEKEQRREAEKEIERVESKRAVLQEAIKEKRREVKNAKDAEAREKLADEVANMEAELPEVPSVPRILADDVTTEHLGTIMAANHESAAIISAEGGIFDTMAGRYSQGAPNIDLYLKSHAGEALRVDRASKGSEAMDDPRLTLALAVQPDVIKALPTKPGFRGRGLVGRFLFVYPPNYLGERYGDGPEMDPVAQIGFEETVQRLTDFARDDGDETLAESSGGDGSRTLTLSQDALNRWRAFWREVEAELPEGKRFGECQDWAGKLPGAVGRIAAVFHAARYGDAMMSLSISGEDMEAAIATGWALAEHALYTLDAMGGDGTLDGARTVLNWIRRHGLTEVTARKVHIGHKSRFPRKDDLRPVLDLLEERGWLARKETQATRGRPSEAYLINPAAHSGKA